MPIILARGISNAMTIKSVAMSRNFQSMTWLRTRLRKTYLLKSCCPVLKPDSRLWEDLHLAGDDAFKFLDDFSEAFDVDMHRIVFGQ